MYKILSEQPEIPALLIRSVGQGLGIVLCKALSKNPEARFSTCMEFVAALESSAFAG